MLRSLKYPDTLEIEEKMVVETYVRRVSRLIHLTIHGEIISTTVNHPFYVKGRGFVEAGELQTEDMVVTAKGDTCAIERIYAEVVDNPETVYNFQVENFHTYHVGDSGILVHNECGGGSGAKVNTVDDIIRGAKDTTRPVGKAVNLEKTGDYDQALKEFNSLKPSNTKNITTQYGNGVYGVLDDGTTLSVRPGSKTGGSTLEIKVPGKRIVKIRY